jgi:fructose-specific component phosphotransferase system IIB-like protein
LEEKVSDTITVNGEAYSADQLPGTSVWIVKWFTATHSSVPNNILAGQVAEAEVYQLSGATWTGKDAVEAAIKQGSWA